MIESLVGDLHESVKAAASRRLPSPERRFHRHDEYLSYGLKTPDFRNIMKAFRPRVLALSLQERLDLAAQLLGYHIGELGHAGIHVVTLGVEELEPLHFPDRRGVQNDAEKSYQARRSCLALSGTSLCMPRWGSRSLSPPELHGSVAPAAPGTSRIRAPADQPTAGLMVRGGAP